MPSTTRGFVQRIDIGRAGLVTVNIVQLTGGISTFVIQDLDADPERFNERLSKLGILRDAMDRAEPVEVQYESGESGQTILSVARITRDQLDPNQQVNTATGLVLGVTLQSQNGILGNSEQHDIADIMLITETLSTLRLELNMQIPERHVASHQFELLQDAMLHGRFARVLYTTSSDQGNPRIVAVATNVPSAFNKNPNSVTLDGFVESLSLVSLVSAGIGTLAEVQFTTTLPFDGPGNTVGLAPFIPETVTLLVSKQSLDYDLFEAGLRDNLRMRVHGVVPSTGGRDPQNPDETPRPVPIEEEPTPAVAAMDTANVEMTRMREVRYSEARVVGAAKTTSDRQRELILVTGTELLAPLASASRPVWILISRETLDFGPEKLLCTPGLPSSDLTPRSLRNMRIPYPAAWHGMGCFNRGVYRFQFNLQTEFRVLVDGEPLCIYDTEVETVKVAHACLGGEHDVVVELYDWICDYNFVMDVYRIR